MFFFTDQLTQLQRQAVETLAQRCKKIDGNAIPIYGEILLQKRHAKSNILWYESKVLIGFCSIFFFQKESCEISLMVAPKWRGQGKAKQMFEAIREIIHPNIIKFVLFSCPKGQGQSWLPQHHMTYKGSEHQMIRNMTTTLPIPEHSYHFRLANLADIDLICALDKICFPANTNDMRSHFLNRLQQSHYQIYLMYDENENFIGKAHINHQPGTVHLSDICVAPERQRQGIGRILMSHCINLLLKKKCSNITLNVETTNDKALQLYQSLGFVLKNAHDYWKFPLVT